MVLAMAAIGGCALLIPRRALAQANNAQVVVAESECKVKYVYLYSFGLLTKWPEATFEHTDNNFVIGVLGDKPFGHILDAMNQPFNRDETAGCTPLRGGNRQPLK